MAYKATTKMPRVTNAEIEAAMRELLPAELVKEMLRKIGYYSLLFVVSKVTNYLVDDLKEHGEVIKLPWGLGRIEVVKYPRKYKKTDPIYKYWRIDWQETKKYRAETGDTKQIIYRKIPKYRYWLTYSDGRSLYRWLHIIKFEPTMLFLRGVMANILTGKVDCREFNNGSIHIDRTSLR